MSTVDVASAVEVRRVSVMMSEPTLITMTKVNDDAIPTDCRTPG